MRRDLANARMGQLVGGDGRTYSIREPRIGASDVEVLIEAGWPVVTYFAGGRLVWSVRGPASELPLTPSTEPATATR